MLIHHLVVTCTRCPTIMGAGGRARGWQAWGWGLALTFLPLFLPLRGCQLWASWSLGWGCGGERKRESVWVNVWSSMGIYRQGEQGYIFLATLVFTLLSSSGGLCGISCVMLRLSWRPPSCSSGFNQVGLLLVFSHCKMIRAYLWGWVRTAGPLGSPERAVGFLNPSIAPFSTWRAPYGAVAWFGQRALDPSASEFFEPAEILFLEIFVLVCLLYCPLELSGPGPRSYSREEQKGPLTSASCPGCPGLQGSLPFLETTNHVNSCHRQVLTVCQVLGRVLCRFMLSYLIFTSSSWRLTVFIFTWYVKMEM